MLEAENPPLEPLKQVQRLNDTRLADALHGQGLVDQQHLQEVLEGAHTGGPTLAEFVVGSGLVGDWEFSRLVSELFNLPFISVDMVRPDEDLWHELGPDSLARLKLIPLCRFGNVVTVVMPGMVSAEALAELSSLTGYQLFPVVGTYQTNARWVEDMVEVETRELDPSAWGEMFDEADAAVLMELDQPHEVPEPSVETAASSIPFPPMPDFEA